MALRALRLLQLDQVWWLVTPGNPLKAPHGLKPLRERLEATARIASHPRFKVTAIENRWHIRFTADLVARLAAREPATRFVWIMGGDNLQNFHLWESWQEIAASVPIAIVPRPGSLSAPLAAPAARVLAPYRHGNESAACLADLRAPAFVVLPGPRTPVSSTALRAASG
ncbi:nicotinate-nucleotide adenylyltransferase [Afifella marina DSM 2698]|uniref:nicotinate-nucleotide adenylyltransferase n=1 Tax=Afifella marina DSM 2698 TaxID=1120955 RepID=A0A1G5MYH0_AFIMA|nr:nicotinate-nucleotide adenylyltransferase [Afifella marina DSM 2698]